MKVDVKEERIIDKRWRERRQGAKLPPALTATALMIWQDVKIEVEEESEVDQGGEENKVFRRYIRESVSGGTLSHPPSHIPGGLNWAGNRDKGGGGWQRVAL